MRALRIAFFIISLLIIGCGKQSANFDTDAEQEAMASTWVSDSSGRVYAIACLHEIADELEEEGASAMSKCAVEKDDQASRGMYGYSNTYYNNRWLPYYYQPSQNTYIYQYVFGRPPSNPNWYSQYFGYSYSGGYSYPSYQPYPSYPSYPSYPTYQPKPPPQYPAFCGADCIRTKIRSGRAFVVNIENPPSSINLGTIRRSTTYSLYYTPASNGFVATGYNLGAGRVGTWTYSNANVGSNQITLWGAVMTFDNGAVVYQRGIRIGTISCP